MEPNSANDKTTADLYAARLLQGIDVSDIQDLMQENPSLRGYLQGYLAEMMLKRQLLCLPGVHAVRKIPDRDAQKGDLEVTFRDIPLTVEVKSMSTDSLQTDVMNETWQGSVKVKNTDKRVIELGEGRRVTSTNLAKGEFDILAICCFPIRGQWDFAFIENLYLPEPNTLPGFIKTQFPINPMTTAGLTCDPVKILESAHARKTSAFLLK